LNHAPDRDLHEPKRHFNTDSDHGKRDEDALSDKRAVNNPGAFAVGLPINDCFFVSVRHDVERVRLGAPAPRVRTPTGRWPW
jgi:hypothetical protein